MFFKVLNLFLLGLALTSCGDTIQIQERAESSTNADSGGWSSSGGGEFVGNRNNPWFMGNQVVRWCINHGGSKNFSLSKNDAKIAIEKVLSNFSTQLKNAQDLNVTTQYQLDQPKWTYDCDIRFLRADSSFQDDQVDSHCKEEFKIPGFHQDFLLRPTRLNGANSPWLDLDNNILKISEEFEYESDCKNAELEFILGNVEDPKVKQLIKGSSEKYFRLKAGAAIRTSYDELRKRAKGYIYIAADKGRYSYRGLKQNEMFWSHHKDASKNIAHAFDLVVAHELGHVLGFKHSSGDERKLMHADYPASVIQGKFHSEMSRYGFNSQIGIFSSGLFNITKKPLTLSYLMPAVASLEDDSFTNLEYFFVFDINPRHSLLDRYSESDNPYDLNQEHRLRIVSFSKKDQRYQTIESYPIKKLHIDRGDESSAYNNDVNAISVRQINKDQTKLEEHKLFRFKDITISGSIELQTGLPISFELKNSYNQKSRIIFLSSISDIDDLSDNPTYLELILLQQGLHNIPLDGLSGFSEAKYGEDLVDPIKNNFVPILER